MNIIDRSAVAIAKSIRANYPDAASETVLKYSLSLMINSFGAVAITLIVCAFTGHLIEGVTVIFFYTLLRVVSGGAHMPTSLSCCITSIIIFTSIAHTSFEYSYITVIIDLITLLILLMKAPEGIQNVSRIDPKYYPLLKAVSLGLVLSNFYVQSSLLSITFFVQTLFLTPFAYKAIAYYERRLQE
jgi:accessory gene regulator B